MVILDPCVGPGHLVGHLRVLFGADVLCLSIDETETEEFVETELCRNRGGAAKSIARTRERARTRRSCARSNCNVTEEEIEDSRGRREISH